MTQPMRGQCHDCGLHYEPRDGHSVADKTCKGVESRPFHKADFYTADDDACELNLQSWEEAIAEHVEKFFVFDMKQDMDLVLDEACPITIYGWTKKVLPTSFGFGESAIDTMLDNFDEDYWGEEYGNCNEPEPPWDKETLEVVRKKLYATMQECIEMAHIWQCDQNSEMVFDLEEVTAMMKKDNPEWWDAE